MKHTWKKVLANVETLGASLQFFAKVCLHPLRHRFEAGECLKQTVSVSLRSLPTTMVAGLFTGAILAVQFYIQLRDFGAEAALGGLNTSGTLREVGPILIAFMLAGKVGAYTSAELASMKVSLQTDAVKCMGIDPIGYLVVPRFFAVASSAVVLLSFGLVVSVLGGATAAYLIGGINLTQYLSMLPRFASMEPVVLAVSKAIGFGVLMGYICCWNGYHAEGGSQGVGEAVQKTATQSMVSIVVMDFLISCLVHAWMQFTH
ncbi:MAG TPA: ABC transporter permease [Bdellovibrionota bacterium]|jgi:phospholipid/cholesterol/gamma-HCH transport system permease protein|nr:ABC transporter permease [Bdellovibrionota bacterium]